MSEEELCWDRWPNFYEYEFKCSHCGETHMEPELLDRLQSVRTEFGKPVMITSGYRCPEYNNQISSTGYNGPHTTGLAVDVHVTGHDAHEFLRLAFKYGFAGVGINQKGAAKNRFIHIDLLASGPRPNVWTY